jgi:hypothetical protein
MNFKRRRGEERREPHINIDYFLYLWAGLVVKR